MRSERVFRETRSRGDFGSAWTYQGGGEDGEEDAEAEHDTVAGGLREDGDTAEEAARGGEGRVSGRSEEDVGRSNGVFSHELFAITQTPLGFGRQQVSHASREREKQCARASVSWQMMPGHVRGILDAFAINVAEVLGEAGRAQGLARKVACITGTGHGALDCGTRVDKKEGKAGCQR